MSSRQHELDEADSLIKKLNGAILYSLLLTSALMLTTLHSCDLLGTLSQRRKTLTNAHQTIMTYLPYSSLPVPPPATPPSATQNHSPQQLQLNQDSLQEEIKQLDNEIGTISAQAKIVQGSHLQTQPVQDKVVWTPLWAYSRTGLQASHRLQATATELEAKMAVLDRKRLQLSYLDWLHRNTGSFLDAYYYYVSNTASFRSAKDSTSLPGLESLTIISIYCTVRKQFDAMLSQPAQEDLLVKYSFDSERSHRNIACFKKCMELVDAAQLAWLSRTTPEKGGLEELKQFTNQLEQVHAVGKFTDIVTFDHLETAVSSSTTEVETLARAPVVVPFVEANVPFQQTACLAIIWICLSAGVFWRRHLLLERLLASRSGPTIENMMNQHLFLYDILGNKVWYLFTILIVLPVLPYLLFVLQTNLLLKLKQTTLDNLVAIISFMTAGVVATSLWNHFLASEQRRPGPLRFAPPSYEGA